MLSQTFGPQSDSVKHIWLYEMFSQTFGPQIDSVKYICMQCLVMFLVQK